MSKKVTTVRTHRPVVVAFRLGDGPARTLRRLMARSQRSQSAVLQTIVEGYLARVESGEPQPPALQPLDQVASDMRHEAVDAA